MPSRLLVVVTVRVSTIIAPDRKVAYVGTAVIALLGIVGEVTGKHLWLLISVMAVLALTVAAGLVLRRQ
jgi:hypothetical protein